MFCAKSGLQFERTGDGGVRVSYPSDLSYRVFDDPTVMLDADTWCSIVAAMSLGGETGETFRRARALHRGDKGDA